MNKFKMFSLLLLSGLVLSACREDTEPVSNTEGISGNTFEKINTDSNDSILSSDVFELEFKQAEVIQSPSEDSEGVYITFDLTNTSEDNIVPFDILTQYVTLSQTTDASLVHLENNYYELDAFGEDTETYNKMVDKNNALSNELLPYKTVEASFAYYLEDENLPLEIKVYETENDNEADTYTFDLD